MFEFWDWIGGRHSYDSAIGLSLLIAIGPEALSRDACRIPCNGRAAPFERNLSVLPGLIGIWYNNFFGAETAAILPFDHYPGHLSAYFLALAMQHHLTLSDILSTIHTYPTMNTGIQQAVFEAYLEGAAAASNRRLVRTVLSSRG